MPETHGRRHHRPPGAEQAAGLRGRQTMGYRAVRLAWSRTEAAGGLALPPLPPLPQFHYEYICESLILMGVI